MALFLPVRYLEGKARRKIYDKYPPKTIYIATTRCKLYKNGGDKVIENFVSYGWFVWKKGYTGVTELKWFN